MTILSLVLLCSFSVFSQERKGQEDLGLFFDYLFRGSYLQFTQQNNLIYGASFAPLIWYSFEHDKRITNNLKGKDIPSPLKFIGQDLQIISGLPLIPWIIYQSGRSYNNNHRMQFALEYASAMYLAYLETSVLSFISVHKRPSTANLSKWETSFRGDSSWPSGHVIPFGVLTFKTLQFYGPWWSLIPAVLTLAGAYQRVQSQKHFSSDIIASFLLCAWASEGVRTAANYRGNHPFYRRVFEGKVSMGLIYHQGVYGPEISWNY